MNVSAVGRAHFLKRVQHTEQKGGKSVKMCAGENSCSSQVTEEAC